MISTTVALAATTAALLAVTLVGVWHAVGRIETLEEYVSASNTAGTAPMTASLVASSLGSWVLFSPAEAAVGFGGITAVLGYAVGLGLPLAVFAIVGVRIRRLVPHGHSVAEYVLARYGGAMYVLVLAVSAIYMFVLLAVELIAIAAALAVVADVPPPVTSALVGLCVFVYTGYGGLVASIVTDTLQTLVMLPLLAVSFVAVLIAAGGPGAIHANVVAVDPTSLSLVNGAGLRFGLYVGLALLGAGILNQGLWQRIYAAENDRTVRRSFVVAAVGVAPVVFLSGLFGLSATGFGLVAHGGHSAFFVVLLEFTPGWVVLLALVTAVLLVMSTVDTLLCGIASLALRDLPTVIDYLERGREPGDDELLLAVRCLTGVLAAVAVAIGAFQISEIRLFLLIDLLCAATFVPVIAGAYTGEVPEWGAVTAAVGGWAVASVFDPAFRPAFAAAAPETVLTALPTPSFTASFVTAVACSVTVTSLSAVVSRETTDLDRLEDQIRVSGDDPGNSA